MGDINQPVPEVVGKSGATETKTWAATVMTFVASFAGLTVLSSVDTDMINSLPDWLEVPAYALLTSALTYLTAYNTKHKPGKLSVSAIRAARQTRA